MTRYYHSSFLPGRIFPVFSSISSILKFFSIMVLFNLLVSCEEDPTKIGNGILPGRDFVQVKTTDTLSVWSYTVFEPKFPTDSSSIVYLGTVYDPYFGTSTSEFVSQIRFRPEWDHEPFTIDSMKLFLKFMTADGIHGTTNTLRISEVTDQLYIDSAYYSTTGVNSDTLNGIVLQLPALKPDSINNIIMTIPVEFAQKFVRDTSLLFYSNSKPDYRTSFKGLHFQLFGTDPLALSLYLEPPSLNNNLHNSYHNFFIMFMHDADGTKKEMQFILDASNRNAYYSRVKHNFDAGDPSKKIEHVNDGYRDTLTYLQYLNGLYTKLVFPGLEGLKNDTAINNIAVNKASLTIPVYYDGATHRPSTSPLQLLLRYKTASGLKYYVPDIDFDASYYDGRLDSTLVNSKKEYTYNFNLAGFVQKYLDDESLGITPELEIFQRFNGLRSVILKANDSSKPVKFEFIYTKF